MLRHFAQKFVTHPPSSVHVCDMQTSSELRRRLATLDCQLKKEQQISRRYQVAAERLLQFTEVNNDCQVI